jgi:predicted aspartyl protease
MKKIRKVFALNLPEGKSAPRTHGTINGHHCELILDCGCTTFIISLQMLKRLGLDTMEPYTSDLVMGDGNFSKCLGKVRGLRVNVSNIVSGTVLTDGTIL